LNRDTLIRQITEKPKPLSKSQKKAVLSNKKNVRMIAGAGAGKTEALTRRILYLLIVEKIDPQAIVAFTFTERAAQSMKSRVYQRIMQLGRDDLAQRLGEMHIGTIHGFCLRILEDYFEYGNYGIFDENQEMAFIMRVGWSLGLHATGEPYSKACEDFYNTVNMVYGEHIRDIIKKKAPIFFNQLSKYEDLLDTNRRLTFSRIIYECVEKVKHHTDKLNYIKHLIVDEFQDIDPSQYMLIKIIGSFAKVFIVGDPRQSIYQWRGSKEQFFHDFIKDFESVHSVQISENRRSTQNIVNVSNKFADCFEGVNYEHLNPVRKPKGQIVKLEFVSEDAEATWIADQIERLVKKKGCRYSDFGILLRSVNTSGDPFISIFKSRRIPYLVGGKVGLFKRDEAQAVGRILSWLSDDGFWYENQYGSWERTTGDELLTSGLQYWRAAVDFELPRDITKRLRAWKESVLGQKFTDFKGIYFALLLTLGYQNFSLHNDYHLACMANLGRFSALVRDYEIVIRMDKGKCNWNSEFKNICWFMNTYACRAYEEQTVEDMRHVNAVQVMTVHQAKGLEWSIVFLPALLKRRFPSSKAGRARKWLVPRKLFDVKRYEGGIEEEKRLFYVALTRARDKLVLSYFKKYKKASQSKFVDILPGNPLVEEKSHTFQLNYMPMKVPAEEEIHTFSTTEIIDYMRCPHHYRLNKLWEYIQNFSPLIGYGEALHFCLRKAAELIQGDGYDPISAVATAVDDSFFLPFADSDFSKKIQKGARKILLAFARKFEQDMRNIVEVETRLEFPLQSAMLVGKVDVIMKDENTYEIRDYKTSDMVITEADSALQLRLYSLGLRNTGWSIDTGSIAYLQDAKVRNVPVNPELISKAKRKAESTIKKINDRKYKPRPSVFCGECEYNQICKWRKK